MVDVVAGVLLTSIDIPPTLPIPLSNSTETQFTVVKSKNRKSTGKREFSDDTNVSVKKSLSALPNTSDPAQPVVTDSPTSLRSDPSALSTSAAGMSVYAQDFKYGSKDPPPYTVQVQSLDESSSIHLLHISKIVSQILPRDILEIKKIGRGKVHVFLKSADSANKLASDASLDDHNLKAFVPSHRILRTGIMRDISQDFSIEVLKEMISSSSKILEIHRLNRRVKVGNDYQYVLSRIICVKFAGQSLPSFIYFYNCRYPVLPFVPKARISYACYRIGHLRKTCKSKPRCLFCGEPAHESSGECPNKPSSPRCLNCGGNHLATSHDCPEVIKHKMVLFLAANENISYLDAKRSVNSSSSFPSSPFSSHLSSDPRFDFRNFPLLPRSNP